MTAVKRGVVHGISFTNRTPELWDGFTVGNGLPGSPAAQEGVERARLKLNPADRVSCPTCGRALQYASNRWLCSNGCKTKKSAEPWTIKGDGVST